MVQVGEGHLAEGEIMSLLLDGDRPLVEDGMAEVKQHTTSRLKQLAIEPRQTPVLPYEGAWYKQTVVEILLAVLCCGYIESGGTMTMLKGACDRQRQKGLMEDV